MFEAFAKQNSNKENGLDELNFFKLFFLTLLAAELLLSLWLHYRQVEKINVELYLTTLFIVVVIITLWFGNSMSTYHPSDEYRK